MDYSKLSDFEINNRVAKALGAKQVDSYENGDRCAIYYELGDEALTVRKGQALVNEQFNPCNNPADAWRIIQENGICIAYDGICWGASCPLRDIKPVSDWRKHPYNPFRMAMIVFLMMQGDEQ